MTNDINQLNYVLSTPLNTMNGFLEVTLSVGW